MPVPTIDITPSSEVIAGLQTRFGSIDYSRWQAIRYEYYSYLTYPSAGAAQLVFFGNAVGANIGATTLSTEDTNMPRAGSFGQQHFLLKTISTDIQIADQKLTSWTTTDATTLASDYLIGFLNAGVLNFSIGSRPFLQVPSPFKFLPPLAGRQIARATNPAAISAVPLTTPGAISSDAPVVTQTNERANVFRFDPNILIEAEQQFSLTIDFPGGAVPVIATSVVNDTTNPLKVGVTLSGVILRPMT